MLGEGGGARQVSGIHYQTGDRVHKPPSGKGFIPIDLAMENASGRLSVGGASEASGRVFPFLFHLPLRTRSPCAFFFARLVAYVRVRVCVRRRVELSNGKFLLSREPDFRLGVAAPGSDSPGGGGGVLCACFRFVTRGGPPAGWLAGWRNGGR